MTQTFASNKNNDLYLGHDGNIVILSGQQAVMAACQTAAQAQLGEMVLAKNAGIPNFQVVWNGSRNLAIFESYLRSTLLAVDGVLSVVSVSLKLTNDVLSYAATIKTIYGELQING